jgi:hypothetical protein
MVLLDQSMKDANPSIAQFMAKLDGRYAGAAWYMPGLITMIIAKNDATRTSNVFLIAVYMRVWHAAQTTARTARRK